MKEKAAALKAASVAKKAALTAAAPAGAEEEEAALFAPSGSVRKSLDGARSLNKKMNDANDSDDDFFKPS